MPAEDHPSPKRQSPKAGSSASGAQTYTTVQGDNWIYARGELWINTKQAAAAQGCDVSEYCWVMSSLRNPQADRNLYLNFCPCQSEHGDMDSAIHKRSLAA